MLRRLESAVGPSFEHVANVDDERTPFRGNAHPVPVVGLDLQSRILVRQ